MTFKCHTGNVRIVTIFPKEKCSCNAIKECYHVLATKLSINLVSLNRDRIYPNLTQLRKRQQRGKSYQKSGRKRPRPDDEDTYIEPSKHKCTHKYIEVTII